MNILYDPYIFSLQKAGGINRYVSNLIERLPDTFHPFIFRKTENHLHVPSSANLKLFWLPPYLSHSSWLLHAKLRSIDIIHPTYYQLTPPFTWANIPGKVIVTVHDFIMARFAKRWAKSSVVISNQIAAIKRADHLICVSQATENDLLERFPECASKSSVIHLASSLARIFHTDGAGGAAKMYEVRQESISTDKYSGQRYFLFVGSRSFYKNFYLTLQAFALLKKKNADLRLVVVGEVWNQEELEKIKQLGIFDSLDLIEYPNDHTLGMLYKDASALFYPSEYEGFGLPPLEAMSMGVPVIALKTSSLPEVVGSGGILIEPAHASAEALAEAASSLLDASSETRNYFSLKAIEQASRFSWEKTVQETTALYNSLL